MDDYGNIEDRRLALLRVLSGLVAMAGLGGGAKTLTRRLRNAVLRLVRPAESAARRLVVALAQNLAVTLPPLRAQKMPLCRRRPFQPLMPPAKAPPRRPAGKSLPLLDRALRLDAARATSRSGVPIISFGGERPNIPAPASAHDLLDATRLSLRLAALQNTLANLPKQAARFARWQARQVLLVAQARKGARLRRPLRIGRPPGTVRRGDHAVFDILAFTHRLALLAVADTS